MKLCKDCKWFDAKTGNCLHESAAKQDYLYGKGFPATINRSYKGEKDCTPDARFFEEKEQSLFTISGAGIKVGLGP